MWPDATQTGELLAEARQGDQAAVNRLLERHRESLRRMIQLRMDQAIRRRVDASDIVQEVLIEAHRRLADYLREPAMPFHLWLRQLAQQRVIDAHRRHRRAARRSTDREQPLVVSARDASSQDLLGQLSDHELTPAAATLRAELGARFLAVLDELDEIDREVLVMRHVEQLTNSEVALALGLSEPAAGMRYLRAMRRLRARLVETGGGPTASDAGGGR